MGVKTGDIFKGFTFDGEASKDYGVYITGAGVYNAPERDVDMISIPGRDGAFAQDLGRFSNITVTYPAGLFGVDPADFAQAISDFRNMLASRRGYCRLTDDYNAGEYREAVFKAGLEVTPASLESGEFNVTFDCKPQRWLTSGEDAVAVTSGDTITNPTLFESSPMLQVWGYGEFTVGSDTLEIVSTNIGDMSIWGGTTNFLNSYRPSGDTISGSQTIPTGKINSLNVGDSITVGGAMTISYLKYKRASTTLVSFTATPPTGGSADVAPTTDGVLPMAGRTSTVFNNGSADTESLSASFTINTESNGVSYTDTATVNLALSYDGDRTITIGYTWTWTTNNIMTGLMQVRGDLPSCSAYSTASALGSPIYFDLDIGEAYKIENGVPISVNNAVTIPATLPTLPPGNTAVTFDNTITQFKIVPRWWKV